MPSTREQKVKEKLSRQLDIMSDVENVDIMLRSYSRNEKRNDQSKSDLNLDSESIRPQQSSNLVREDFRLLLNTNSRENSEMAIETTRMISEEISNQMSRKLPFVSARYLRTFDVKSEVIVFVYTGSRGSKKWRFIRI